MLKLALIIGIAVVAVVLYLILRKSINHNIPDTSEPEKVCQKSKENKEPNENLTQSLPGEPEEETSENEDMVDEKPPIDELEPEEEITEEGTFTKEEEEKST